MEIAESQSPSTNRIPVLSLIIGNAVSLTGSTVTIVALPWFVLRTTGSASNVGLVGFSAAFPRVVAGVFGGAIIDRIGPKRMSVTADVLSAMAIVAIPLLYRAGGLRIWQLLGLVFIGNLLGIPGSNARRAIVPELARLADVRLEQVNSVFESIQYLARLLGAPLAGLLIVLLGTSNVLWVDGGSFAVSAVLIGTFVPKLAAQQVASGRESYWRQMIAGIRFLLDDRLLFWMALALTLFNPLSNPLGPVILPVYADRTYGSAVALGVLVAAIGIGGVMGASVYGLIGHRLPRRWLWLLPFVAGPVEYWGLILHPSLPSAVVLMMMVGLVFGPFNPVMSTVRQERVPLELRGRVFSLFSAVSLAAQPVGIAVAGLAIDAVGFNTTVLVFAAALQTLGIALIFVPALSEMNTRVAV